MAKDTKEQLEDIGKKIEDTQTSRVFGKEKEKLFSVLEDSNILSTEKNKKIKEYFKNILEPQEFRELQTLVIDSNNIISWKKLIQDGVVNIEDKKVEWIYWKNPLNLEWTRIKNLWKLKKVNWWLFCDGVETLEDLWNLELVEGLLELSWTKVRSLWKLKKVWRGLNCYDLETLENIWKLEEVRGCLYLKWTKIKSLWKLKKVWQYMACNEIETLEDLWELEEVGCWLSLKWTKIKSLWKLKKVWQYLNCYGLKTLKNIWNLEEVWGELNIKGCNIKIQLETIKKVREWKLKVLELKYEEYIDKLYEWWKLKHEEFKDMFGSDIKEIKDEVLKKQAVWILEREYKDKKEEIQKKIDKIMLENQGKSLIEKEKREIKDKIKGWDRELTEVREQIESFGIKL